MNSLEDMYQAIQRLTKTLGHEDYKGELTQLCDEAVSLIEVQKAHIKILRDALGALTVQTEPVDKEELK